MCVSSWNSNIPPYLIKYLVPADGGVKGKTWGPSTVHQKERVNLPVFKQDIEVPNFSKSAPDLDKARICTPSSTNSSYNELGKSYDEGLSTISRPNYLENNVLSGNGCNDRMFKLDNNDFSQDKSKINKNNNKKYSLDSRIENNGRQLTNRQLKLSHSFDEEGSMGYNNVVYNNNESLTYDRIFHRKIQKSLELLTSYENPSQDTEDPTKVNWKSSDNLSTTMRFEDLEGPSQFQREEFFTNSNFTNDTSSLLSNSSILKKNHVPSDSQDDSDVDDITNRIRSAAVTFYKTDATHFMSFKRNNSGSLKLETSLNEKPKSKRISFYQKFYPKSNSSQIEKQKKKVLKTPPFVHKLKDKFTYNKNKKIKYKESIYNKEKDSASDIHEQLLESEPISSTAAENNEAAYGTVFYTRNYVLASNNLNK